MKKIVLKLAATAAPLFIAAVAFVFICIICSFSTVVGANNERTASETSSTSVSSESGTTASMTGNEKGLAVSKNLIAFIESWESYAATGYRGQDYWNVTIGYGHVELAGENFTSLTQPEAEQLLIKDMKTQGYITCVQKEFSGCTLKQNQFDALVDLAYGLGTACWDGLNLTVDVKNGADDTTIQKDFEALCHVKTMRSEGLFRRRHAEGIMYTQGIYELNK
jgi:lysozyme